MSIWLTVTGSLFENGQSVETEPLDVIEISEDGAVAWQPQPDWFEGPVHELAYVLRAYGSDGNFDETSPQPLWAVYGDVEAPVEDEADDEFEWNPALFTSYGENSLTMHNIGLSSGTISVRGSVTPGEQDVWVAGRPVPVDEQGNFIAEEILPEGAHTVEVAVLDKEDYFGYKNSLEKLLKCTIEGDISD